MEFGQKWQRAHICKIHIITMVASNFEIGAKIITLLNSAPLFIIFRIFSFLAKKVTPKST